MTAQLVLNTIIILHFMFILFVVFGGLLVWWKHWLIWLHLPCVLWGAVIEFTGQVCPLTPLENRLRAQWGYSQYEAGFIDNYIMPLIYPPGLSRELQLAFGLFVLVVNGFFYWVYFRRFRKKAK